MSPFTSLCIKVHWTLFATFSRFSIPSIVHIPKLSLNPFFCQLINHNCIVYLTLLLVISRIVVSRVDWSGHRLNGLYYTDLLHLPFSFSCPRVGVALSTTTDLWHHCPGHLFHDYFLTLVRRDSLSHLIVKWLSSHPDLFPLAVLSLVILPLFQFELAINIVLFLLIIIYPSLGYTLCIIALNFCRFTKTLCHDSHSIWRCH